MIHLTINGQPCTAEESATLLEAAAAADIYVPAICSHPDLPPFQDLPLAGAVYQGETRYGNQPVNGEALKEMEGCGLCVVEVEGVVGAVRACVTPVAESMVVQTDTAALRDLRRLKLMEVLARHPHACVTCAQQEGCSLVDCSSSVPAEERCCQQFHDCELRRVAEYVGVKEETPRYRPEALPVLKEEPLFDRDFNLCIHCARCVRACNEVRGVGALGVVHHDGRLVVGSVAPTLKASECKFCGACVEVCPTGCLRDRDAGGGEVPCTATCPARGDVPGYIRRIAAGDFEGAAAVIWESLPLPNVLGRICYHSCEDQCRRGGLDEALAICALKRFALEHADRAFMDVAPDLPSSGKRVAVVGAGPAGLAAAYFLRFKGHEVAVYEAADSPGGMPQHSIPEFRLPRGVLERDLDVILGLGVEIRTGYALESGEAMADLLNQGHDAVLIAVGLPDSKKIPLEGSSLDGVHWGLEFLTEAKLGKAFDLGSRVVVVGGGNVAVDAAMTARRLSGGEVHVFCLESREAMPAHGREVRRAEAEGIEFHAGWGPAAVLDGCGQVSGVEFRMCTMVSDAQQNFAPAYDETQRIRVEAEAVILAVGQAPPEHLPGEGKGIFLAGARLSAVEAVASGRAAAGRIDLYFGGDGEIAVRLRDSARPAARIGRDEGFASRPRIPVPCAKPEERCTDFREIEGMYTPREAVAEARRCLQCDLRLQLRRPFLPPEKWLPLSTENIEAVPEVEGVFILAGADRVPTAIKGTATVRADLLEAIESGAGAAFFRYEEDRMYSRRESELLQQHLDRHGELPGGDELDDLF